MNERITQLEEEAETKDEEIAAKDTQITELEATIVNLEKQLENPQTVEEEVSVEVDKVVEEESADSKIVMKQQVMKNNYANGQMPLSMH
ncbi:hypothetical protein CV093_06835 [Oceanobacillus sp. 143]|nr:hypothetical protein CV093_06835 [Oceanobacillus sp. 143]